MNYSEIHARAKPTDVTDALLDALEIPDLTGKEVLIAGTGQGTELACALKRSPARVVAVDISDNIFRLPYPAEYVQADLCALPAEWIGRFDYVLNCGIMQHTADPKLAFANIARVTKPGGTISIGHIYAPNPHNVRVERWRGRWRLHARPVIEAERVLRPHVLVYTALCVLRLNRFAHRIPWLAEFSGQRHGYAHNHATALDYYCPENRHLISRQEVEGWFAAHGMTAKRGPKQYIGTKPT